MIIKGDIFLFLTNKGSSYLQYINETKNVSSLCRVIYKLESEENIMQQIENTKEDFCIHFPLKAALKRKIIIKIGNAKLPNFFNEPIKFREIEKRNNEKINFIIDRYTWKREIKVNFSEAELNLSPWGIWNDTLLKENIENDWNLISWN